MCVESSLIMWMRTLTMMLRDRYTASRLCKKIMDLLTPRVSLLIVAFLSLDALTITAVRVVAALNLVETALNVFYLYLAHVVKYPAASVVGFTSVTATFFKTVLYWLQEYYCNYCDIGHNDLKTLIVYWIIPDG